MRQAMLVSTTLIRTEHIPTLDHGEAAVPTAAPPEPDQAPLRFKEARAWAIVHAECQAILRALQATRGNKSQAARLLGIDFKTLHLKMRRYGIQGQARQESVLAPEDQNDGKPVALPLPTDVGSVSAGTDL